MIDVNNSIYCSILTNNFVAEGIVTHNTTLSKRKLVLQLPVKKPWGDPKYFYAAPTYMQAKRVAWFEFMRLIPKWWIAPRGISVSELSIQTIWGSSLHLIGLDKPQRAEGSQYDAGVIDECADVDHVTVDRAIMPAMTWRGGWIWKIGVPKRFGVGAQLFKAQFKEALAAMEIERKGGELASTAAFTWSSEGVVPPEALKYFKAHMDPADYAEQFRAHGRRLNLSRVTSMNHVSSDSREHRILNLNCCRGLCRLELDYELLPGCATVRLTLSTRF